MSNDKIRYISPVVFLATSNPASSVPFSPMQLKDI